MIKLENFTPYLDKEGTVVKIGFVRSKNCFNNTNKLYLQDSAGSTGCIELSNFDFAELGAREGDFVVVSNKNIFKITEDEYKSNYSKGVNIVEDKSYHIVFKHNGDIGASINRLKLIPTSLVTATYRANSKDIDWLVDHVDEGQYHIVQVTSSEELQGALIAECIEHVHLTGEFVSVVQDGKFIKL